MQFLISQLHNFKFQTYSGRLHVPIHSMVPLFQSFKQLYIKIPKHDYLRFIKSVGKLAKFAILLQDAHEGGSVALVSGQS